MQLGMHLVSARVRSAASTRQLLDGLPSRWCLLREADTSGPGEIEYDILVDGDGGAVRRYLRASGARPVRSWGRRPHRQFSWWDPSEDRPIRLDLVDELGFGAMRELRVPARDIVLDGVTIRNGWPRPDHSNEQWLALFHALLDRDHLRRSDHVRLGPWRATIDDDVALTLPRSLRTEIDTAARSRDWAALEARRETIRTALARRQPVASAMRRRWRASMRRSTKLQRAILRPGVRIALLGPDGAGKSTTIDSLIRSGVVESSVYLGVAPAGSRQRSAIPGMALLRTTRRLWGAWLSASVRRRRGQDVALDRHPSEAMIGPPTSKRTTMTRRWILAHVLPSAEVVVVLMAPAEVLHQRKPEHELEDVVARRARYVELARRHGYPLIETTEEPGSVITEIRRVIHRTPRRGWAS